MFDEDIVPGGHSVTEQLMNIDLKRAYDFIRGLDKKQVITIDFLKKLSGLVMRNTGGIYKTVLGKFDSSAGDLRLVNVSAGRGGKSYLNYQKVPLYLGNFCDWINVERKKSFIDAASIYAVSFEAHYRLVTIHPWIDGNGRTSRLFMNMIQLENNVLPTIIKKEYKAKYIEALIASQDAGDSTVFIEYMIKLMTNFLEHSISDFEKSNDS